MLFYAIIELSLTTKLAIMPLKQLILSFFIFSTIAISCSNDTQNKNNFTLRGSIDYLGDADFYIEQSPIHYKYAPKNRVSIPVNESGGFELNLQVDTNKVVWLTIDDQSLPIYAETGNTLNIEIERASFPNQVVVKPDRDSSYHHYSNYLTQINGLDAAIEIEMNKFRDGFPNEALALSKKKLQLAEKHLNGTPFENIRLKVLGELYVNKIKFVEYQFKVPNFNADRERALVLEEALKDGFFELDALVAQRAGIRDFAHYYARTFGIYDKVRNEYGTNLAEIDIKRIALAELDSKRLEVIDAIPDRKAKAYARMHLVAERIGELPMDVAEPTYHNYLAEYSDYTTYTNFLTYFYKEIKAISPGSKAIPFTLKDIDGNNHSMDDYLGKYVLLDFWAGWCQPCLDEFPKMRNIYNKYSRDDFEIIGISNELNYDTWVADIARFKNPWVQLYGGNGFNEATFKSYKGGGIPFYILIDPDGNIARYNDVRATFNLEDVLDSLIN